MTAQDVPFILRNVKRPRISDEALYQALKPAFPSLVDSTYLGEGSDFHGSNIRLQRSLISSGIHPATALRSAGASSDDFLSTSICVKGFSKISFRGIGTVTVSPSTAIITSASDWSLESSAYAGLLLRVPKSELFRNLAMVMDEDIRQFELLQLDFTVDGSDSIISALKGLESLMHDALLGSSLYDDALLDLITLWIAKWMTRTRVSHTQPRPRMNQVVEKAMELIRQDLYSNATIGDIARVLGISERYLQLSFRSIVGASPKQWTLSERLKSARNELNRYSISELAERYGFSSPSHFSIAFKRKFGASPKHFRNRIV
jgi:AraC-like DNA-binding protein